MGSGVGIGYIYIDVSDLFSEKLGITFDEVTTSPHADMFSGLRPLEPAERALLERSTQQTYATFLSRVAQSRGMSLDAVDSLAQGRVWTGRQAQSLGLVDTLGTLRTAIQMAAARTGLGEGDYRIHVLPRPPGVFEMLSNRLGATADAAWSRLRRSPSEQVVSTLTTRLQEATSWHGRVMARMPLELRIH